MSSNILLIKSLTYVPIGISLEDGENNAAGVLCERCGHKWVPRDVNDEPRVCPKCKSPYWNKPRRDTKKSKTASN